MRRVLRALRLRDRRRRQPVDAADALRDAAEDRKFAGDRQAARALRGPTECAVIVGVDEAGAERAARGVGDAVGGRGLGCRDRSERRDPVALDQNVAGKGAVRPSPVTIMALRMSSRVIGSVCAFRSFRKLGHEPQQNVGAGGAMVRLGEFLDIVADASGARDEDHAGGANGRQHLRVVTGAARQPLDRQIELPRDRLDACDQFGCEGNRLEPGERPRLDALGRGAAGDERPEAALRLFEAALSVLRRSTVMTARSATTLTRLGVSVSAPTVAT